MIQSTTMALVTAFAVTAVACGGLEAVEYRGPADGDDGSSSGAPGTDDGPGTGGSGRDDPSDVPDQEVPEVPGGAGFVQVIFAEAHACALAADGHIECWGSPPNPAYAAAPEGAWVDLAAGWEHHFCAIGAETGEVVCWGWDGPEAQPPPGPFVQISASLSQTCGVRPTGLVECWGVLDQRCGPRHNEPCQTPPADVRFKQIALSGESTEGCGIRLDDTVLCWGEPLIAGAPEGRFTKLALGGWPCGLRVDGEIICWGGTGTDDVSQPPGPFVDVTSSVERSCGLRPDGEVLCWNQRYGWDAPNPPDGWPPSGLRLSRLGENPLGHVMCGIDLEGQVVCWGQNAARYGVPTP